MTILEKIISKIYKREKLREQVNKWKEAGDKIVFTNGCFDILHYGHISYLARAADLGNKLIIGLNADASVKRLKGEHRPINDQKTRELMLAALEFVDAVVPFEEDTPLNLIKTVLPDVLVKGGDWRPENIIGNDVVAAHGGITKSLPFVEGYSTTAIEQKIKESGDEK